MKKEFRRAVSLFVVALLLVGMLPTGIFAEETTGSNGETPKTSNENVVNAGNEDLNPESSMVPSVPSAVDQTVTAPPDQAVMPQTSPKTVKPQGEQVPEQNSPENETIQTSSVEGDFEYADVEGGVSIIDYTGSGGDVVIPATLGGKKVVAIGDMAFQTCYNLASITIPDSVTSIGNWTFSCCGFTDIRLPNSLTSIGDYAFDGCGSLTSITIQESVTSIGDGAFRNCDDLTSINADVKNLNYASIGGVLYNKTLTTLIACPSSIENITIPNSVTAICDWAFSYCHKLTSITLPDSVSVIGDSAFESCYYLTSITLSNSLTAISDSAFSGCYYLTSITLPNSVISIGDSAFDGCINLTSITLSNSLTTIGDSAFSGCYNLTSMKLPNSVITIDNSAFYGCAGLTDITVSNSLATIGGYAFKNCSGLTSIVLPDSVTTIGDSAFYGCSGLTSITLSNSLTNVGREVFDGCIGLTSIVLPDSITTIDDWAFYGCTGLTDITLSNRLTVIGYMAFSGCSGLTSITFPNSLTTISRLAFSGCSGLTSIKLPDSVTELDSEAFADCISLTNVQLSNNLKHMSGAFMGCRSLTGIIIPLGMESIDDYAFVGCSSLTNITIPSSVTNIGQSTFNGCTKMTSINVVWDNMNYSSREGVLYDKSGTTLLECPGGLTGLMIPIGVTNIGDYAFGGCSNLTRVTMMNDITSIGEGAFVGCSGLESITLPEGLRGINRFTFSGCSGLTSINIPDNVTYIGDHAFGECINLNSVYISESVTSFADDIFWWCDVNLIICGKSGSAAEYYAIGHGLTFEESFITLYIKSFTITPKNGLHTNIPIQMTAEVDGINPSYQYQFSYQFNDGPTTILKEYSSNSTASFTPTEAGWYTFKMDAMDAVGTIISRKLKYEVTDSLRVENFTTDKASSQEVGTDITLTANGSGGLQPYHYKFYYKLGTDTTILKDFDTNNMVNFKPDTEGSYTLYVDVKDNNGAIATQSIENYQVGPALQVKSLTANGNFVNQDIQLTAEGTGGKAPYQYKFYYQLGTETGTIRDFSNTPTATFNTSKTGIYTLYVDVKDADDNIATKTIMDYKIKDTAVESDFQYTDITGGVKIIGYTGSAGDVVVPATLNGKKVLEIGYNAFSNNTTLTSVNLPEGVTTIGVAAFQCCSNLTSISLPKSLTSIEDLAFNCACLTELTLPEALKNIGFLAFGGGIHSATVNIPKSVTTIGDGAFSDNYDLNEITVVADNPNYTSIGGVLYNKTATHLVSCPGALTTIDIAKTVKSIGQNAFEGCSNLTSISFPEGVTDIGDLCFYGCNGLTTIHLPKSLSNIGDRAFEECNGLERITVAAGNTKYVGIGGVLYNSARTTLLKCPRMLSSVDIPTSVTTIGECAFQRCLFTEIALPAGLVSIEPNAFFDCENLTAISLPQGVTSIGDGAFCACYQLQRIDIPQSVTSIGDGTFDWTDLVTIYGVAGSYAETYAIDKKIPFIVSEAPIYGIKSFIATPDNGQYVNSVIKLDAEAQNGKTPYQYQFSYTLNGVKTVVKAYSSATTASFTPTKAGSYTLTVEVKDSSGAVVSKSIDSYTVAVLPIVASFSADKASGQLTGAAITLTAEGSGGIAPYSYRFYTKLGTVTTDLKGYEEDGNTATFTPATAGSYTLCVDVKDAGGKIATKNITSYSIVNPLGVKSFTTGKTSGQAIGTTIALTALGSDGKSPYQYRFAATLNGETTTIKDYSATGSATFTPAKSGDYTLTVDVKDAAGNTASKTIAPFNILADPVVDSFKATAPNGQGVNTGIQLEAAGSGQKGPYQYKFYWKKGTTTTIIQNFGAATITTFKPTAAGVYNLCVDIKDGNGRIGTKIIDNYEIYGAPTVKSLTADKASGQYVGTGINLTAEGSDGKAPYTYKFYVKLGTATTVLKEYTEAGNTATFTPDTAGSYTLCVDVKDDNGIVATKTITGYSVIGNPEVKSFTTGKVSGQAIGTAIALTATGTGGKSPYQYQFSYTLNGVTRVIKDYNATGSATFKPGEAGDYTLMVSIRDAGGITATRTIEHYIITLDPVVNSFKATAPNGQGVNTSIQLEAVGSSGKDPYQYQFYYKQGTTKVIIRTFAAGNTATFKPTKAGVYDMYVDVKDSNGRIATGSIPGYSIYAGPTVSSLTTDKVSGQYVDTAITLTAAGTGGTPGSDGYTYTFYFKLGTATDRISIQDESGSNTATFAPKQAGLYTLFVDIKDANGIVGTKSITSYKIIANPAVKTFTTSKPSGQLKNTSITLTAAGMDGKTPYQYKFSYSDGTTTTTIRDYSTLTTATFKPTVSGTYTLIVEIRDAGNRTATQSIADYVIK